MSLSDEEKSKASQLARQLSPKKRELLALRLREKVRPPSSSKIVCLKRVAHSINFFLIPPLKGISFSDYAELANCTEIDFSCYSSPMPGLQEGEQACETVEALAEYYIEQIKQLQPHGPYYFAGWSFGGIVAYEMAIQLQRRSETLGMVGIINADLESFESVEYLEYAKLRLVDAYAVTRQEVDRYDTEDEMIAYTTRRLVEADKLYKEFRTFEPKVAHRFMKLEIVNFRAMAHYHPDPYSGPLTLFRVTTGEELSPVGSLPIVRNGDPVVQQYIIQGDQYEFMKPPTVRYLAACLREAISKSQP
jgi:thioesterase domain-containing protein